MKQPFSMTVALVFSAVVMTACEQTSTSVTRPSRSSSTNQITFTPASPPSISPTPAPPVAPPPIAPPPIAPPAPPPIAPPPIAPPPIAPPPIAPPPPAAPPPVTLPPVTGSPAALPQTYLTTTYVPATGSTITVNAGGSIQSAIDNARPGDEIVLQANTTFSTAGGFYLRNKACTFTDQSKCTIVIRSSGLSSLPEGVRVQPGMAASMARIIVTTSGAAIYTEPGAHHYRLVGIEIAVNSNEFINGYQLNYGLVELGSGSQTSLAAVPHDITIDRCYIHGHSQVHSKRGVNVNSASTAIIDSYISEFHGLNQDAQAIAVFNGPGPFKFVNNYLSASGENMNFGGADPKILNLVPADIEVRRNHFMKPLAWKTSGTWWVKNLFESKNSKRVLIEANVFENAWVDQQSGTAILLKSVNQDGGCNWCVTQDVTVRYNIIRHVAEGIRIAARPETYPAVPAQRLMISNNLLYDVGVSIPGSGRPVMVYNDLRDVTVEHTTADVNLAPATLFAGNGPANPMVNFISRNNIIGTNGQAYSSADGYGSGTTALNNCAPGWFSQGNVFSGTSASNNPAANFYPASLSAIGFKNASAGDYSLTTSSPYAGKATDGSDPGVNMTFLNAATAGVVQENPSQ